MSEKSKNSIQVDCYEYDKAFNSVSRSNNWLHIVIKLYQRLIQKLQEKGLMCNGNETIKVADIGCGSADLITQNLQNIDFKPGFDIRAIDINPKYAGKLIDDNSVNSTDKQFEEKPSVAEETLLKVQNLQTIPLRNFMVKQGDAFKTNLLNLLSIESDTIKERKTFQLVCVNHLLYYVAPDDNTLNTIKDFIDNICTNLLSQHGIAIFVHCCVSPRSVGYIQYKYAYRQIKGLAPTRREYRRCSIDYLISNCCKQLDLSLYNLFFSAKLKFSDHVFDYENVFKNPSRYKELDDNVEAMDDLYKMIFFTHRSPNDLYCDKSNFGLVNLVDDIISFINNDGCIDNRVAVQVLTSRHANEEFKKEVESVVQSLQADLV